MKQLRSQNGVIIIGAFIVTFFFLVTALAVAEFGVSHYVSTRRTLVSFSAMNAAEAGADAFMTNINSDSTYQGTNAAPATATNSCTYAATPTTLTSNSSQGKVTYESCVQNGTITGEKVVTTMGKVYLPSTASTPTVTRKVRLIINQATTPDYPVMTGPGGLNLGNNVHIYDGPVYVGGKLTLGNNAGIGTAVKPVSVYVDDKACPSPATSAYPSACSSGNSITTSANSQVFGDTHPRNNVDVPSRFTNPGVADHTIPTIALPSADHGTLTAGITTTKTISSAACSGGVLHLSGHYTGSSSTDLNPANNCTVILDGDVWIDGNLALGNNNTLKVSDSVTTAPNVIIDGSTGFTSGNNADITANSSNVGFNLYTFWSTDSSCRPSCSNVTGTNLDTSADLTTIDLSNNVSGSANIKFYARWTKLVLGNNAVVGQLMGQTIDLNNNGTVQFSNSSSGTPAGWDVRYYTRYYK